MKEVRHKKSLISFLLCFIFLISLCLTDFEVDVVSVILPTDIETPSVDDFLITLETNQSTIGKGDGILANLTLFNNGINPVSNIQVDFGFDGEYTEFTNNYPQHQEISLINSGFSSSLFIELKLNNSVDITSFTNQAADVCLIFDARGSLAEIGTHEQMDTMDWLLSPLRNIVKALTQKKGTEKATLLQKEFENLNDMRELQKVIFKVVLEIPLYFVAKELGLALRDTEELQASLNYLQLAYQSAPAEEKNRIVTEITGLIGLGVTPTEFSIPVDHDEIRERISKRTIRCFSCGEERTNVNKPCSNCGVDTVQCSVCKLAISFGSNYLECSHCQNIAHREHLLEWIKVKGTCPICQQKLVVDNLTVAQEKD